MTRKSSMTTPRQNRGIEALLRMRSIPLAAEEVGVSARTVYRWLEDPRFKAELSKAEGVAIDTASRNLVRLADSALALITQVLANSDITPAVRLRAAGMILDNLIALRELRTTEERLSQLEAAVYGNKQTN